MPRPRTLCATIDAPLPRVRAAMHRVLIADDHALFRAGVGALLAEEGGFEIAGEAATAQETLRLARENSFDILLLDLKLPDRSGIDILGQLRAYEPDLPILVLSAFPEGQYALNLLRAGANGYLSKDAVPQQVGDRGNRALDGSGARRRYGCFSPRIRPRSARG